MTSPRVEIVSYSNNINKLVACAARISTQRGTASDIWNCSTTLHQDQSLIQKVLSSGHESILEHACFTLSFTNVSAFVEQFFIEHRLASFTVKSRRYVDFRDSGYYVPCEFHDDFVAKYQNHVSYLFEQYSTLIEVGIPKEDARFVLPYCFYSNFYCTLNARELKHILKRMSSFGICHREFSLLYQQIVAQLDPIFHFCIPPESKDVIPENLPMVNIGVKSKATPAEPAVMLTSYLDSTSVFRNSESLFYTLSENEKLEHVFATFSVENISLAGITHISRHRIQSLVVPDYLSIDYSTYILPQTIRDHAIALSIYQTCFQRNLEFVNIYREQLKYSRVYLCLSGNVTTVITSINARELAHFFRLRCCNRAQWEIRSIAHMMLAALCQKDERIFGEMGPSCSYGKCPEGRMTCGHPYQPTKYGG